MTLMLPAEAHPAAIALGREWLQDPETILVAEGQNGIVLRKGCHQISFTLNGIWFEELIK